MNSKAPEKACRKCGGSFPLDGFHVDRAAHDGHRSFCKPCERQRNRENYYRDHDKTMAAEKRKRADPKTRERNNMHQRNTYHRYPEKYAARFKLNRAIETGQLVRQPCHVCGAAKSQGHHHDYNKPLDVEWLCQVCHSKEHRTSPEGLADLEKGAA